MVEFCNIVKNFKISDFKRFRQRDQKALDDMLTLEVPALLRGMDQFNYHTDDTGSTNKLNPFMQNVGDMGSITAGGPAWVVDQQEKAKWDNKFYSLQLHDGKVIVI